MKTIKNLSIRQAQDNIKNFEEGYTLVELLAVITIVVVVGVIVAGILVSSLRGGSKSNVLDNVRENGNSAITQMSKMLIYAQYFNGVSTDGSIYTTNCIATDYKYIKITSFDGGTTIFSCNDSADNPPNTLASQSGSLTPASLIDVSTVLIEPGSCNFRCTQDNFGQAPTIGINFTLKQNTASSFTEKQATIPFKTSVTLRNSNY